MLENKPLILNAYHSISREQVETYLYQVTYKLLIGVVDEKAAGVRVRDEDKSLLLIFISLPLWG